MDIETIGGCCPNCNNLVLIKLVPNSLGAFQFDACPTCGFIEFENSNIRSTDETTIESRVKAWISILEHNHCDTLTELKEKQIDNSSADPIYGKECVFLYNDATDKYIKSCVVSHKMINDYFKNSVD